MRSNNLQIKVWRKVIGAAWILKPHANSFGVWNFSNISETIQRALNVEHWRNFADLVSSLLVAVMIPSDATGYEATRRAGIIADSTADQHFRTTYKNNGDFVVMVERGVALTISPTFHGARVHIAFDDAEKGTKAVAEINRMRPSSINGDELIIGGRPSLEPALYIQSRRDANHWVWSKESRETLGARVVTSERSCFDRSAPVYRLAPAFNDRFVTHEDFIVYEGTVARELGLDPTSRVSHPDAEVFASVGPFSLAYKRAEPNRRNSWDRLVAFRDDRLPIRQPKPRRDGDDFSDIDFDENW